MIAVRILYLVCGDRSIPVQRNLAHTSRILTVLIGRLWPAWTGPAPRQSSGNVLISWSPKHCRHHSTRRPPAFLCKDSDLGSTKHACMLFELKFGFPVSLALVRLKDFHFWPNSRSGTRRSGNINRLHKKVPGTSGVVMPLWRGQTVHILQSNT